MNRSSARRKFGPFEVDPATGELWKAGLALKIAPQPSRLLATLVERPGTIVTRAELRAELWPDGTTVEFDQGLNYCIRQLRIVLGDQVREPRYIETIPKRGYRFLAEVTTSVEEPPAAPGLVRPPPRRWVLPAIAAALLVAVGVDSSPRNRTLPNDPRARRLFLEAEHLAGTWEAEKVSEAVARYEAVTRLIPEFAPAWAGWANADVVLTFTGPNRAKALADSEVHARMAVALDDSLGSAYAALGHSSWQRWQWRQAEDAFRRGIELAAGAAVPHQLYGLYLASVGHSSQAIAHASRAVEIEPLSGVINYALAQVYLQSGQFEAAIAQARRTLTIDRHFPLAFHALIRAHALLGRTEEAWQVLADLQRVSNRDLPEWRAYLLARKGDFEGARVELAREAAARAGLPAPMAGIFALAAMGDADGALDALEYAFAHHSPGLVWLGVTPELASLRSAPRFSALLERMHRP